jgi:glycosyltransferase involved in cell wall biosynthesis
MFRKASAEQPFTSAVVTDVTSISPRVSIGMPVYNGEALLESTLESLLRQTFRDFELVVCDNASTDRTRAIAEAFAARDQRVRYVRNDRNIGANANFTKVAQLTTAPLFKWAAHDDLYAETYLERCVAILDANPDIVMAHSDAIFINEDGTTFEPSGEPGGWIEPATGALFKADPVDLGESRSPFRRFAHVIFGSLWGTDMFGVIRRSALDRTRLLQDTASADRPLLAELALLGPFRHAREPLYLKRFHSRMTYALCDSEVTAYVSGDGANYSKRGRQLRLFLSTPEGKPVSVFVRAACRGLVFAYGVHVAVHSLKGRRHRAVWPPGRSDELETAFQEHRSGRSPRTGG